MAATPLQKPEPDGDYYALIGPPPRVGLVASMSFAAGYVDANTKIRFHTFGSLMTGNAVDLGLAISQLDLNDAGLSALNIVAFQLGVFVDLMCTHRHTTMQVVLPQDCSQELLQSRRHAGASRKASAALICGLLIGCDALGVVLRMWDAADFDHGWCALRPVLPRPPWRVTHNSFAQLTGATSGRLARSPPRRWARRMRGRCVPRSRRRRSSSAPTCSR